MPESHECVYVLSREEHYSHYMLHGGAPSQTDDQLLIHFAKEKASRPAFSNAALLSPATSSWLPEMALLIDMDQGPWESRTLSWEGQLFAQNPLTKLR